jgi:hypothetical protein
VLGGTVARACDSFGSVRSSWDINERGVTVMNFFCSIDKALTIIAPRTTSNFSLLLRTLQNMSNDWGGHGCRDLGKGVCKGTGMSQSSSFAFGALIES